MKHKFYFLFTLLLLAFGNSYGQSSVLSNGNLESYSQGAFDNWGFLNSTGYATLSQETTEVHGGSSAAKVTITGVGAQHQPQLAYQGAAIPTPVGSSFMVSFWIKGSTSGGSVRVSNAGGTPYLPNFPVSTTWQEYTAVVNVKDNAQTTFVPYLDLGGAPAGTIYYIDDIQLRFLSAITLLPSNGGFNDGGSSSNSFYWWGLQNNTPASGPYTFSQSTNPTNNNSTAFAAQIVSTGANGAGDIWKPQLRYDGAAFDVTPNTNYTVSFYLYPSPSDNTPGTIRISNNGGSPWGDEFRVDQLPANNWTKINYSFNSGSLTTYKPMFDLGNLPAGTYYIDEVSFNGASQILPLKWLSVTATLNTEKRAVINWRIDEKNVQGYEVEKSKDGRNFETIVNVISKGDGANTYSFKDGSEVQGTTYYRIKQKEKNGDYSYSTLMKLSGSKSILKVYPNPVKDFASISNAAVGTTLMITDIQGRLMQRLVVRNNSFTINIGSYPAGEYFIKIDGASVSTIIKQ